MKHPTSYRNDVYLRFKEYYQARHGELTVGALTPQEDSKHEAPYTLNVQVITALRDFVMQEVWRAGEYQDWYLAHPDLLDTVRFSHFKVAYADFWLNSRTMLDTSTYVESLSFLEALYCAFCESLLYCIYLGDYVAGVLLENFSNNEML